MRWDNPAPSADPLYDRITDVKAEYRALQGTVGELGWLIGYRTAWARFEIELCEYIAIVEARRHFMRTRWQAFVAWVLA